MNKGALTSAFMAYLILSSAQAQENNISNREQYCKFTLPDELDLLEAEERYDNGEALHPNLSAYFSGVLSNDQTHKHMRFRDENLPQIITGKDYIQVYADFDDLVGDRFTIDRIERPDEELTILDSPFNGALIEINLAAAEISVTLRDGLSETRSFDEIDYESDGENDTSVLYFKELNLIAYPLQASANKHIVVAVNEPATHKDALLFATQQYLISLESDGYISAQLGTWIDYKNPLLQISEEFANLFPPMMICNSGWQRTSLKSLDAGTAPENSIGLELDAP